ncbi:MAG TPA: SGNH/GDSL hydrolase family protein [Longimicrobiaceae bacterium]|nr:SGNH/GDSL hydrolase family protein [Longimicrobiaceae bacterium]
MADVARARGGWRRGLLVALGSLLVSLAAAEVFLRVAAPQPDPYASLKLLPETRWPGSPYVPSAFPPHHRLTLRTEPGLPGMDGRPRRFTVNHLGYRGDSLAMPKPAGELRVFMVGGSTTECIFLDDAEAVTAVLERRLNQGRAGGTRVKVYGAGKSGDRSYDHVAMVAHRIAHLQPDVIVVFAGINDLAAAMMGRDYLVRSGVEGGTRLDAFDLVKVAATELHLPRLLHRALTPEDPRRIYSTSQYGKLARQHAQLPLSPRRPVTNVAPYAENLATLMGIARAQGARAVLMTQQSTWNSPDPRAAAWHWLTGGRERFRAEWMAAALEEYNQAVREVGRRQEVPVFDLARALPGTMDYFYDDVHFNVRGAEAAGTLLARFLVEQGVVPPAR